MNACDQRTDERQRTTLHDFLPRSRQRPRSQLQLPFLQPFPLQQSAWLLGQVLPAGWQQTPALQL
jgi:hypothetical protein